MNRGGIGAKALNVELQAALNPAGSDQVERFGWSFVRGDKVMQIENDYDKDVYNGDIGFIDTLDPEQGALGSQFRRTQGRVHLPRTRHPSAGLCHDVSQEPGIGVSGSGAAHHEQALRHVAEESHVHRHHPRQAAGGWWWASGARIRRAVGTASRSHRCSKLGEWMAGMWQRVGRKPLRCCPAPWTRVRATDSIGGAFRAQSGRLDRKVRRRPSCGLRLGSLGSPRALA